MDTSVVAQLVTERGKPNVVSLSADTHVFHFDRDGFWEDSPILFVNRNGHHFRLIEQAAGDWLFAKTWNGVFETQPWQTEANLRRPDAAKCISLCGVGPQGKRGAQFEALSLLPRDATTGRRKAVWRQHMIDVHFDRGTDNFHLYHPETGERVMFTGKLWESADAAQKAAAWFADAKLAIAAVSTKGPLTQQQTAVLEDNPLWGMF